MKKVAILLFITSSFVFAQNTYVPDDKFEQALINLGYDTTMDDSVLTANISGVTSLNLFYEEISDLTGIEAFVALEELELKYNKLTSLDMSKNTALKTLKCQVNKLTSLDVTKNTALEYIYIDENELTSLDVTKNTALKILKCERNKLTSLDVSKNTVLKTLKCDRNKLTSLDVSKNTALETLECHVNELTSLDVTKNTALKTLDCAYNYDLPSLDVTKNTALETLSMYNTALASLDVSKNTALKFLYIGYNKLTSLNMRNGVTDKLSTFNAVDNSLTCIETLDPAYATTNWTNIDAGVTFAVICGGTDLTTLHVATTGSDASGSGTETSPLATIQTGINAASSGDTVSVAAGTYEEQVQFNSKNISLIGQDSSNTIIKWNGGIAVSLENGLTSHTPHIKNFTIKDGYSDTAGGILISNYGSPVLENLRIVNNTVIYNPDGNNDAGIGDGGGINIYNSSPTILNSYIAYNTAEKMGGGINVQNSTVTIKNTIIANNTANQGGGIYAQQTPVYFSGTVSLLNNHASTEGGGISFDGAAPNQLLTNFIEL